MKFAEARVVIIGDLILDEYLYGSASRLSPEAPVPVVGVKNSVYKLGGAANVAANVKSLGGIPVLIGCIGIDYYSDLFRQLLRKDGIDDISIVRSLSRPTALKTRIIAGHQQVARLDRETTDQLAVDEDQKLCLNTIAAVGNSASAIIVSDYAKGVITRKVMDIILEIAEFKSVPIFLDPKVSNRAAYPKRQIYMMTPNEHEACGLLDSFETGLSGSVQNAGGMLLRAFACNHVLVTRGENGMSLFSWTKSDSEFGEISSINIPAVARSVYDVSGAGDTVIATMAVATASGVSAEEAAHLANKAAGIVVGKAGTATVSIDELFS